MSKNKAQLTIIYGILLATVVALIAYLLAMVIPQVGAATLAIVLGIILGNTLTRQVIWQRGTKLAEGKFLEVAVVLLGFSITLQRIAQMGWLAILFIVVVMFSTLLLTMVLGRLFGVSQSVSWLIGGGSAICGSSAIASIAPVVGANDQDKGLSITLINLMGTVMMLVLPIVATLLYSGSVMSSSALIGGTLPSVGQVAGASNLLGSAVSEYAMLFKIMRIALLGVVVITLQQLSSNAKSKNSKAVKRRVNFFTIMPWYVLGFFLTLLLSSVLPLPSVLIRTSHALGFWLEIIALAAIGLRLNFRNLLRSGGRLLPFVFIVGILQVVLTIAIIPIFIR